MLQVIAGVLDVVLLDALLNVLYDMRHAVFGDVYFDDYLASTLHRAIAKTQRLS